MAHTLIRIAWDYRRAVHIQETTVTAPMGVVSGVLHMQDLRFGADGVAGATGLVLGGKLPYRVTFPAALADEVVGRMSRDWNGNLKPIHVHLDVDGQGSVVSASVSP